jgi:dipeptide/tripeptide permease
LPATLSCAPPGLLFLGLYTVALGTGGIKPNVSAFGADQFDTSNPAHVVQKASCACRLRSVCVCALHTYPRFFF